MIKEVFKELDAMTAEQREKMLYFIIPLYAMKSGHPEAVQEALEEAGSRYTMQDIKMFKTVLKKLEVSPIRRHI